MLLCGLAVTALVVHMVIERSLRQRATSEPRGWASAVITALLAMFALAVYPERLIQHPADHLLTVVIGAILLFAPMRALLISIVPYGRDEALSRPRLRDEPRCNLLLRWGMVVGVGASIGMGAFIGEMSEGGGSVPLNRMPFVASAFVGLGLAGLLIAYAFLGTTLGIGFEA